MPVWLISDTHFGEQPKRRIKRSGMTAEQLDALIERNWRERISPQDTVWHLGDIGKGWRLLADLPGEKHLILAHAPDRRRAIQDSKIFATTSDAARLRCAAGELLLIHNPDPVCPDEQAIVIHGHHHYDDPLPGRISVCVDHSRWGPVPLEGICERIASWQRAQ